MQRMKNFKKFLVPKWIDAYTDTYREGGFRGLLKKGGVRLLVIFILFYLIRDSILYLVIPYLIAKGVINIF